MAIQKITADVISSDAITTASISDSAITAAKLAGTLDLTGKTITIATASSGDNDTSPASTAFVQQEISALVDSSPDALNTLNELAAALGDDANFSTTVTNSIATKLPLAGGTLTGALNINNSSGFGNIELGGSSGGYVDFKTPFSDDYDARIIYPGGYLQISTSNNEPILLKHNESEKLRTTATGIDVTGNATFDDDGKALFGAGFDLQIYHNGNNSFIDEVGTGILYIRAATDLRLTNANASKLYANFEDGGASKLYHDNALSILTTTSGAEIREGLTVGSSANDLGTTAGNQLTPLTLRSETANTDFLLFTTERLADGTNWTTAAHRIQRKVDATKMGYIQFGSNADDLITFGESETEYMRIDGSGNVGIGTTSPNADLHIYDSDGDCNLILETGTNNSQLGFGDSADNFAGKIQYNHPSNLMAFHTNGSERMRIDSDGSLFLNTTSAMDNCFVSFRDHSDGEAFLGIEAKNDSNVGIRLGHGGTRKWIWYSDSNDNLIWYSNAASAERMRILANGNLGVGTGNPKAKLNTNLEVEGSILAYMSGTSLTFDGGANVAVTHSSSALGTGTAGGLLLANNNNSNGAPSPLIAFSARSASSSYNHTYATIHGEKSSSGADSNWNTGALIFSTGSGTGPNERMRIDSAGRLLVDTTSIGNASTNAKVVCDSEFLARGSSAGYFWENRSGMTIASQSGWGGWYSTGSSVHYLYSDGANRASIGRTSGTYTALSDVNKKKDFEDSTVGLAEVMQLQPKKFRMLDDADDAPKKLGFVAQDVENVIPEAYVEDLADDENEETFIGLTDRPIIAALTKAIQEQQTIIDDLKSRIETLEG